ncbi:hypothetical protein ABPG72_008501 [Tetrahymena utriculariae]
MSSLIEEEIKLNETLEFLQEVLEKEKNLKTINKYGGKGGFGLVLFVESLADPSQKYAVKAQNIINTTTGKVNQNVQKMCEDEAEMMRQCKHKNVVEIHSDYIIGFFHFIQMNLCKCSLNDWIQKNQSQIDDIVFLHYANQIIDGLEYLHNKDYVLRDLSVRNILISTEGVIKLCDFGLAKKYDSNLKSKFLYTSSPKGVYFYFPPEVHEDYKNNKPQLKQTMKGDIWAFGVCLCLLGGVKIDVFFKVNQEDFEIPKSKNLSEKANELIKFILIRNPQERPTINQIRQRIFDVFLNIPDEKNNENKTINNQAQNQIENMGDQPNLQNQQNSFESQQPFKVERILDFNFAICDKLYQKYEKHQNQNQNNIDFLLTLGFLECKFKSNYKKAQYLFERVLNLDENETDAYIGLCDCIMQSIDYSKFSKLLSYSEICLNKDQYNWRALHYKSFYFYVFCQYHKSLENLEKIQKDKFECCQILSLKLLILDKIKNDDQNDLIDKITSLNKNNDPIVYLRLGFYYQFQNEMQKSQHFYQKALEFSPNNLFCLLEISFIQKLDKVTSQKLILKAQQLFPYSSHVLLYKSYLEEDDEKKLDLLSQAIQLDSCNCIALSEIGIIKNQQKQFKESIQYFEKVLVIIPDDQYSLHQIAQIYAFDLKEYEKAINLYKKCIKMDPNTFDCFNELTKIYKIQNNYTDNEKIIRDNLQKSNQVQKLYELLSDVEYYYGNYDLYIQYIDKAIELDPNDINCLISYMYYFLHVKKDNEIAREYVNQIYKLDPNNSRMQYYFGITEKDQKQKILYYKKQLEINPNDDDCLNDLGVCYYKQNNYEDAIKYYKQAFQIDENITVSNNITQALIGLKQYDQALEQSKKSLEINQQNYYAYKLQGNIYSERKDHQEAIENYEKALMYNQNQTQIYLKLAQEQEQLNNLNEALKNYQKHVQFHPNSADSLFKIGFLQNEINKDMEKAIYYYEKSIKLKPSNNAQSYKQLGLLYKQQEQFLLAKENLLIAIEQDNSNKDLYLDLSVIEKNYLNDIKSSDEFQNEYIIFQKEQLEQIQQYREEKNFLKARQLIQKFLNDYPENIEGNFEYAQIEYYQQNYDQAIIYFFKSYENTYQVANSLFNIGLCYQNLDNYQKALEFYLKSIKLKDNNYSYFVIGKLFIQKLNRPQRAIKFFRRSIELNIQDKYTQYYLGKSFEKINFISEALECFTKYLQQNPDLKCAEYCKDYIKNNQNAPKKFYKYKDYDESDSDLEDNIQILNQAEKQMQEGNLVQAIQSYQNAIDTNPTTKSQLKLAYAYLKNQQSQNAAIVFEEILEKKLNQKDQYENILQQYESLNQFQLALYFFFDFAKKNEKQNKFENAIIVYEFILKKEESNIQAKYKIGINYRNLERIKESLDIQLQIVKIDPEFQMAYFEIGFIYVTYKKNPKQAIKFLRRSIELNPNHMESHYYLGIAFEVRKYNYEALQSYYKVQQLSPTYDKKQLDQFISINKNAKVKKYKPTKIDDSDCSIF